MDADDLAGEIGGSGEGFPHAKDFADRARKDADADHADLLQGGQQLLRNPGFEDLAFQLQAVDQQRCQQGLEAGQADPVKDAGADPGEIDHAGPNIVDRARLVVGLVRMGVGHVCDLQGAFGQLVNLVDRKR